MLVGHVFDFAVVLRCRRRELRLRQDDLADYAGVSRGFICDLEHGKPSVEFGKVLQVMAAMNVPMSIGWNEEPPAWAKPFRKRALARERRHAARRPRTFEAKARPDPKAPASWHDRELIATKAWIEQRRNAGEFWSKDEIDRFAKNYCERDMRERDAHIAKAAAKGFAGELSVARALIVAALALRAGPSFRGAAGEPGTHDNVDAR